MTRATSFSGYKSGSISAAATAVVNAFAEENNDDFLSVGDSVAFVGKCRHRIANTLARTIFLLSRACLT